MPSRPAPFYRPRPRKGVWFPLCLAGVVLIMLPGVALLVVSLLGAEGPVNAWTQENLRFTFHNKLADDGVVWPTVSLLLMPVFLALLYFLKLRRKAMEVPSTFLWRKSIEDLHVNSLFQWLRDNVLLLVQLGIVLFLIYAVLDPRWQGSTAAAGKASIILIDNSASMNVKDVLPDRLSVAKKEALELIDAMGPDDSGMVIEFNSRATLRQPYTREKALLRAAVGGIQPTQRPTRVDEALALADSLANPQKSTDDQAVRPQGEKASEARSYVNPDGLAAAVHLFSDGRFPDVPGFTAGNLSLQYHRIGAPGPESVNNVGIVAMNALRDEKDSSRMRVFVRVLNFRRERAEVTVVLEYGRPGDFRVKEKELKQDARDGKGRTDLSLDPRVVQTPDRDGKGEHRDVPGERSITFELEDVGEEADLILHAKLKDHRDQFALDDEAYLIAGVKRKARVLLVSKDNDALTNFFDLEETRKVASVTAIAPADLKDRAKYRTPAQAGEFDLVVFDRCAPDADAMPLANTFFIDDVPPPWQRRNMPKLDNPGIRNPASSHPLMRDLRNLDELAFAHGFRFNLYADGVPPRIPRLLEADRETALMFVLPRRAFQDLVLTCPLHPLKNDRGEWIGLTSTWPLKSSFPVFLRNVLYQLGNVSDAAAEENVQPGDVKVLRPESAVDRVEVLDPKQGRRPVKRGSSMEFAYQNTDVTGVYLATWSGGSRLFAVNLLDAEESNTQPRDEIKLGEQKIGAGQQQRRTYDAWKWIALGALALLLLEWFMYHRRA